MRTKKKKPARHRKPKLHSVTLWGVWCPKQGYWLLTAGLHHTKLAARLYASAFGDAERPAVARRLCTTKERA